MSIQLPMPASTMTASQIMMGIGITSCDTQHGITETSWHMVIVASALPAALTLPVHNAKDFAGQMHSCLSIM